MSGFSVSVLENIPEINAGGDLAAIIDDAAAASPGTLGTRTSSW